MDKHARWASEDGTVYVVEGDERLECVSEGGRPFIYHTKMVALVYGQDGVSADDNARLIAKAPLVSEMTEALRRLVHALDHAYIAGDGDTNRAYDAARTLLAKIGGQS